MPRYHVSEDGKPRVCSAQSPESCTARGIDGEAAPHGDFKDANEARHFAESVLEESFGESKSFSKASAGSSTASSEPLPSLSGIYGEAPRVNIGVAQTYGNLNGIQKDLDAGYIDESDARSRIAGVVADLKRMEEYDSAAQRPGAIAFRERLEGLADGAERPERFVDKSQWKAVAAALSDHLASKKPSAKEDRPYEVLLNRIGESKSGYDGFSIANVVELSKDLEKITARARKPELVALRERLGEAIANPTGASATASTPNSLDLSKAELSAKLSSRDFSGLKGIAIDDPKEDYSLTQVIDWQEPSIEEDEGDGRFLRVQLTGNFRSKNSSISEPMVLWLSERDGSAMITDIEGHTGDIHVDPKALSPLFAKLKL